MKIYLIRIKEKEKKMKIELDSMQGGLSVTNTPNCQILRHIYGWSYDITRCLLRIYAFKTKTIVIASHLIGGVYWDSYLIPEFLQNFYKSSVKLNYINSCLDRADFGQISEREISLYDVEELIECELEPVETWLDIDADLYQKKELRRQNKLEKLLELYLEPDLEKFTLEFERMESVWEEFEYEYSKYRKPTLPVRGALFFDPEIESEGTSERTFFFKQQDLLTSYRFYEKSALPYVNNYDVNTEVVICVRVSDEETVCGIFSRINVRS